MTDTAATPSITDDNWKFPLLLSCLAGGSTCLGAAIVFMFTPAQIQESMPFSLSLAASVMITVSVISILPECLEGVIVFGIEPGADMVDMDKLCERLTSFTIGCLSYWALSKFVLPDAEPDAILFGKKEKENPRDEEKALFADPQAELENVHVQSPNNNSSTPNSSPSNHNKRAGNNNSFRRKQSRTSSENYSSETTTTVYYSPKSFKEEDSVSEQRQRSWRVAMLLFFSLLCHNFPEGLAVAASAVESKELGVAVAIGILIHNIPEGIAIAVPCIAARPDSPWLAFWLASGSGLAEPLGAVVALFALEYGQLPLANVLACVAGIMCTVAVVELYPEAYRSRSDKKSYRSMVFGTLVGMVIMMATEWYLP